MRPRIVSVANDVVSSVAFDPHPSPLLEFSGTEGGGPMAPGYRVLVATRRVGVDILDAAVVPSRSDENEAASGAAWGEDGGGGERHSHQRPPGGPPGGDVFRVRPRGLAEATIMARRAGGHHDRRGQRCRPYRHTLRANWGVGVAVLWLGGWHTANGWGGMTDNAPSSW